VTHSHACLAPKPPALDSSTTPAAISTVCVPRAEAEVLADDGEVGAAGLLALAVGQQLVRLGLGLLAQEPQRRPSDPGDLVGNEADEPQRAQLHREAEPVPGAARAKHVPTTSA
jgi:hypothetical protein